MLEVLTRRYYKIRDLDHVRSFVLDGRIVVTADYPREGRTVQVIATHVRGSSLPDAVRTVARLAELIPPGDTAVVDLYVQWEGGLPAIRHAGGRSRQGPQ